MRMRKYFLFTVLAAAALSGFAQDENLKTHAGHQQMKKTENVEIEAAVKQAALPRGEHDPMKAGVAAADPSGETYVLFGSSMFDAEGNNVFPTGGAAVKYPVYINIDESTNKAIIENIVDMRDYDGKPAEGDYNPDSHTITIAAPEDFYSIDDYQIIGTYGEYPIYLHAVTPYGMGYVTEEENLILDVSEDFSRIVPTTGFAASICDNEGYDIGYLDVIYDACILKKVDGVSLNSNKVKVDFGTTYIGNTYKQTIKIFNVGSLATDYVITCSDPSVFSVSETSGDLQSEEFMVLDITFMPSEQKDYTAVLYVESEGETLIIDLFGNCEGLLDYNRIVKEGDFVFESSEDYPWLIESRDGNTVAINGNKGKERTESILTTVVNVPEKCHGTLSWNGFYNPRFDSYDRFFVYVDDEKIMDPSVEQPGVPFDISNSVILPSGAHTIKFVYRKGMTVDVAGDYNYGEDIVYIYDLALVSEVAEEFDAKLSSEKLEFGKLYAGSYSCYTKTNYVSLTNTGYGTLEIIDIKTTNENFMARVSKDTAEPQESIEIEVIVDAITQGEINGDVVIETNAGEFSVKCHASAVNLPDFSQIVSSGDFDFDTDFDYPFIVEDGVVYNSTSQVVDNSETTSYFIAYFTVPAGKTGKLRWSANVDAAEYSYESYSNDVAACMIDLSMNTYYGQNDAGYTTFGPDQITNLQPGEHSIGFYYVQAGDGKYGGMDRLNITDLSLEIEELPDYRLELWQAEKDLDFGDVYSINKAKKSVKFANTGRESLEFISISSSDGYFYGNCDDLSQPTMMTYVSVPLIFDPRGYVGMLERDVTISTTSGDLVLKCKANSVDSGNYLLIENFEFDVEKWSFFDTDEDSDHQWKHVYGEGNDYSYDGNGCLASASCVYDSNDNIIEILPDNYAVSPSFTIPKEGATLTYYIASSNPEYCMETYDVMIGNGMDITTYRTLGTETLETSEYQLRSFELDEFAGQTVNVIFRHHTDEHMDYILLDDVKVLSKGDIGIEELFVGKTVKYIEYYSVDGIKVENPEQGVYICRTVFEDNTVKTEKIMK